jgi:hypothetical protein
LSACLLPENVNIKIHETVPVVLYACETCHVKAEHRLAVTKSSVLERIFGPKRGEQTRGSRKLHDEKTLQKGLG